jgi:hypothetical protein
VSGPEARSVAAREGDASRLREKAGDAGAPAPRARDGEASRRRRAEVDRRTHGQHPAPATGPAPSLASSCTQRRRRGTEKSGGCGGVTNRAEEKMSAGVRYMFVSGKKRMDKAKGILVIQCCLGIS